MPIHLPFSHRLLAGFSCAATLLPTLAGAAAIDYPKAPRGGIVDNYYGTTVPDPYRGLEDVDAAATREWVAAEQALTTPLLEALPERAVLKQRLTELWNYERRSLPHFANGRRFFTKNDGLQNQAVLYVQQGSTGRVLLDPNLLAADGTTALTSWEPSAEGTMLAYTLAQAGSDWETIRFRNVASGQDDADVLDRVKFTTLAWTEDGKGLFYSRYPDAAALAVTPAEDSNATADQPTGASTAKDTAKAVDTTFEKLESHRLYYHRLGTAQREDVLVHAPEDASWFTQGAVTDDGRYLSVQVNQGSADGNRLYVYDLQAPKAPVIGSPATALLGQDFKNIFEIVGNVGATLYVLTTDGAPNKRVVAVDLARPESAHWRVVVPESRDVIESVTHVGGQLLVKRLHDASSQISRYSLAGKKLGAVKLPGLGDVNLIAGKPGEADAWFQFVSFNEPGSHYRLPMKSGKPVLAWAPLLPFKPADYVTEQIFYQSKDGTRVPMFVSAKRGLKKNGSNPTLLYGYGGFNISLPPAFSAQNLAWMERGGVYAQPNLRGGAEYGESWHRAGTKAQKQNVFDDFAAAAETLIARRYTSAQHLGIHGRSNGGLLVGATLNQRPELFAAAVPGVGVMDMLRFHQFTIGAAWRDDYGSSETAEGFAYLRAYSPLHNVRQGVAYPPTLTITADHDDRVVPGHSFKYAATMQWANKDNPNPQLIRIEERGGHGAGKPTSKKIDEVADVLAFLAHYTQ